MTTALHPLLVPPGDPIAIAELTASIIRADRRLGQALPLPAEVRYVDRASNVLSTPAETARRGSGPCWDLVRAEGGFRGTHVGCIRTPGGFHVFLAFFRPGAEPVLHDIALQRGMAPPPPDYAGAVYVPIWESGPYSTVGPDGHDVPLEEDGHRAWDRYVFGIGLGALSRSGPTLAALEAELAGELARADGDAATALEALLAVARARGAEVVAIEQASHKLDPASPHPVLLALHGALSALATLPPAERPPAVQHWLRREPPSASFTMRAAAPAAPQFTGIVRPKGACPGSCSLR